MARTAVVALGGNAITRQGQPGTHEEQLANARVMARGIAGLRLDGWRVVVPPGGYCLTTQLEAIGVRIRWWLLPQPECRRDAVMPAIRRR
jgi:hypothetical protein